MSRPYMIRVSRTVSGRKREPNNRGNRSGRERSIPTWGHGCCRDSGRRKCADLAQKYERPPEDSHLQISKTTSENHPGPSKDGTSGQLEGTSWFGLTSFTIKSWRVTALISTSFSIESEGTQRTCAWR